MADKVSEKRRSEIMSHIHSKDTSIEILVRKWLFSLGYRFRVNYKLLPGKPDIVFTKKRVAIFIHGCFWHGHDIGCRYSHTPQSRQDYWSNKINRTRERDEEHISQLERDGWRVLVLWECEINQDFENTMQIIMQTLNG